MSRPSDYERGVRMALDQVNQVIEACRPGQFFPLPMSDEEADLWGGIWLTAKEAQAELDACAAVLHG